MNNGVSSGGGSGSGGVGGISASDAYRRYGGDDLETMLLSKTSRLKDISINLGNEIKDSNKYINGLNDDFDKNNTFIKKLIGNLDKLPRYSDCKLYFYTILFALFVFICLYFIIKWN